MSTYALIVENDQILVEKATISDICAHISGIAKANGTVVTATEIYYLAEIDGRKSVLSFFVNDRESMEILNHLSVKEFTVCVSFDRNSLELEDDVFKLKRNP